MSREFQFVPQTSRSLNTRSLGPSAAPFPLDSPLTSSLDPLSSNPSNLAKVDPPRSSARSTRLIWQNVTFTPESVHRRWLTLGLSAKRERRQIISGLTGELACGQLKAIIGPSGVGKSTLLKIITGRRTTHVTGNIFVRNAFVRPLSNETISRNPTPESKRSFGCSNRVLAKIAYIPQNDYHLRGLTVRESLRFAAQLKLYQQTIPLQAFHSSIEAEPDKSGRSELERLVSAMLQVLMLQDCGDTLVPNCSGGQVRRLSIGVELLGFPQLILLDEPTTGLDFVSALQIVRMLRSLTELPYRPGILCTIHQPSCEILQLFTHLYIIGSGGVCIYDGHVSEIEQTIALFDLQCPPYFNLADYLLQCSYGEFGLDLVRQMAKHQTCEHAKSVHLKSSRTNSNGSGHDHPIARYHEKLVNNSKPFFGHLTILINRTFRNQLRTSEIIILKLVWGILIAVFLGSLHNYHTGEADQCFGDSYFAELDLERVTFQDVALETQTVVENVACVTFLLMFIAFIESIPTCLTFSREVRVIIKERSNGWYLCLTYYLAKSVIDIPIQMIGSLITLSIFYPLTGQSSEYWRFGLALSAIILCALIVRFIGLLIGAIFIDDEFPAVLTISALIAFFILVGGLFIKDSQINWPAEPFYFVSPIKFSFHIMLNALYGLGRCDENLPIDFHFEFDREQLREHSGSLILMWFEVRDKDFWLGYVGLSSSLLVLIVITYLILNWQINRLSKD